MAPPTVPIIERFTQKYRIDPQTGCWLWTASIRANGYSQFRYSKAKNGYGHIFAYEQFVGDVPEGHTIDHLCRNRSCVNPAHLEAVRHQVNVLRGEGPAARNANKQHCPQGHPYDGENLYVSPSGRRVCRACQRRYRQEHREELAAYQREYMRKRYANDPAFRERVRQESREREARKRAEVRQLREQKEQEQREYIAKLEIDAQKWRALGLEE